MKTQCPQAIISVDLKKNRIRIHKSTLHLLGDPPYIQLLVNPDKQIVAVRSLDRYVSGDQVHRITRKALESDNSIEIYSQLLSLKLMDTSACFSRGGLFKLTGIFVPSEQLAVFPMKSLFESKERDPVHEA